MSQPPTRLLVMQGPSGRSFAVVRLPRGYAVDDVDRDRRVGELRGDMTSLLVDVDDVPHVLFAGDIFPGDRGERRADHVVVELDACVPQTCHVKNGVWISAPEPFTAGTKVTAIWRNAAERELWRYESPPLADDAALPLVYGPEWIRWGPPA